MRIQRQPPRNTGEGEAHATPHQRKERKGKHQRNSKQANTGRRHSKDSSYIPSVCTVVQNRRRPPVSQPESCHLRPNERSQKSGTDFGTSRPGNPTPRHNRAVSPAANTDHIRRKGESLRSRTVRMRPAQASEPHPPQQGGRNACAPPFAVCTNVPALIKESYLCHTEGGTTPALCHSQNERSRPRKRRNNIPNSSERYARALPFAVCTNVPVLIKESYLWHAESGSTPALCHSQNVRACPRKRRYNIPNSNGKTPVLCNFQSVQLFRRRTYSTVRFASAIPAAKGRRTPLPPSFWKARFINLFAGKSPPLPFIRRYTIPVVNAA